MRLGLVVGACSALLVAVFSALNKRLVEQADAKVMTCLELGAGTVFLTLLAPLFPHVGPAFPLPDLHDGVLLVLLSLGCTLLPFTLALVAMRELSAFTAQLVVNLEPVYAIILAVILFHEQRELGPSFYAGVAIILAAVFAQPWITRPRGKHPEVLGTMESKSFGDG
jgi:drug/metabolite transporter (DMT)-like permease